jgi:RNA polymerase sigma-70 factor, ECF subfamily
MGERDATGDDELRLHLQVLRCQAGDERAFAALFERFAARTLRYLRGLVDDAAEDVQQEVWLAVYRGVASLSDPRAFRTWLYRTTRHRAVDYLRRRRRERELVADVAADADAGGGSAAAHGPDDDPLSEPLDAGALHAALATLPPVQREALVLRYQDGLSYAEIALVVGCSVGTVRSRLHHAKRRLHDAIAPTVRRDQP